MNSQTIIVILNEKDIKILSQIPNLIIYIIIIYN